MNSDASYCWLSVEEQPGPVCLLARLYCSAGMSGKGVASLREASADEFFATAPQLQDEEDIQSKVSSFIARHQRSSSLPGDVPVRKGVVCVTSGGTTVPLERKCVRYIDNFSSGNRGAASTEYFLKEGYAVVFLSRRGSMQPFCRGLPSNPLLRCFEAFPNGTVQVQVQYKEIIHSGISKYQEASRNGDMLCLAFTTLFEYLQILRLLSTSMESLGPRAMFYLAAAVSDFYVPWAAMVEHKIQSGAGPLAMELARVPKMLPLLRRVWAPQAFAVSFKLETDMAILLQKAQGALNKYGMHAVVANELQSRRTHVTIVTPGSEDSIAIGSHPDIEAPLVSAIVAMHEAFLKAPLSNGSLVYSPETS